MEKNGKSNKIPHEITLLKMNTLNFTRTDTSEKRLTAMSEFNAIYAYERLCGRAYHSFI